jgi:hypothetical protein
MSNNIKLQLPSIRKYRLLSDLQCFAVPYHSWKPNRKHEIENLTGIKYFQPQLAGQLYTSRSPINWETKLPNGLVIEIKRYSQYRLKSPVQIFFKINKKDNAGWPTFSCFAPLEQLNGIVLEEI